MKESSVHYDKKYKIPILVFVNSIWIGFALITYVAVHFDLLEDPSSLQYISAYTLIFMIVCTWYCGIKKASFFQKYLMEFILWLGMIFFIFMGIGFYLWSDGFRDYKPYCSHFIPLLDDHYLAHHKYPDTLAVIDDKRIANIRYTAHRCGYQKNTQGYSFYFSEGMTIYGYSLVSKKWWRD